MSIKQQKDIRKFLEGEYTFDTAEQIYKKQEDSLMAMLETVKNESKSRYKTLKQTILPRIALYKVLGGIYYRRRESKDPSPLHD